MSIVTIRQSLQIGKQMTKEAIDSDLLEDAHKNIQIRKRLRAAVRKVDANTTNLMREQLSRSNVEIANNPDNVVRNRRSAGGKPNLRKFEADAEHYTNEAQKALNEGKYLLSQKLAQKVFTISRKAGNIPAKGGLGYGEKISRYNKIFDNETKAGRILSRSDRFIERRAYPVPEGYYTKVVR